MTSIWGRGCFCRERTSEGLSESSPPPESSHDEITANPPAVESLVAKYTKEDLQKILRTVFEAQALSNGAREKPLKARSPDVYRDKSYMECYNFYQQYEDYFATTRAKSPNRIFFTVSFLRDCINFRW